VTYAVIFAREKRGEDRRNAQSEKRARALAFYEAEPYRSMYDVAAEMDCCPTWARAMVNQARNERRQRAIKINKII